MYLDSTTECNSDGWNSSLDRINGITLSPGHFFHSHANTSPQMSEFTLFFLSQENEFNDWKSLTVYVSSGGLNLSVSETG